MHVATMRAGDPDYGAIREAAVAVRDGRVAWVGPAAELPDGTAEEHLRGEGRWLTPGLIDCHTHLVFGGNRAAEFEERLGGKSYEEIARAGGGIASTVRATRAATEDELFASAADRLRGMLEAGVTTVEIKSGYGLDVAQELRMLTVARRLGAELPVTVVTSLLGAHALPKEYASDRAGYVDLVAEEMIPRAAEAGLADAVDAFCEGIAFTPEECTRVFDAARAAGLPVKLHADQLSDLGGAALAARHGALSAEHLEYTSDDGARAMAESGTVAVLLPGAFHYLGETRKPPVRSFREAGVPMAVATDLNPGSSPVATPLVAMNLACVLFGLTPEEALAGSTRVAAQALGLGEGVGTVQAGSPADLALWAIEGPGELSYWLGRNPCHAVIRAGKVVMRREAGR